LTLDAREQPCKALRNLTVTLRLPVHKALAQVLNSRYPASTSVAALAAAVVAATGEPRTSVEPLVLSMLEELLILGAVRIRRAPVQVAAEISARPRALPSVRTASGLALSAGNSASVCNQWHDSVGLTALERCLLPLLDGAHSHAMLADHLVNEVLADRLRFVHDDNPLAETSALKEFALKQVAIGLNDLRRRALLVA